eukprot:14246904-Alexandrium_andersonii.AAC.1
MHARSVPVVAHALRPRGNAQYPPLERPPGRARSARGCDGLLLPRQGWQRRIADGPRHQRSRLASEHP